MHRFLKLFGSGKPADWNQRVLLPVIHVRQGDEFETAYRGALIAYKAGADGVFLIAHSRGTSTRTLTEVALEVAKQLPVDSQDFPVGVNYLPIWDPGQAIHEAMHLGQIPMVWSDSTTGEESVEAARKATGWEGLYFGGVAFKYQDPVALEDLPGVAKKAAWMDVPTTSGEGTGEPIDLEKARIFTEAIPDSARAVASGASIDNINSLLPYFHAFLVASSIAGDDFHSIDSHKTRELAEAIHNWKQRR